MSWNVCKFSEIYDLRSYLMLRISLSCRLYRRESFRIFLFEKPLEEVSWMFLLDSLSSHSSSPSQRGTNVKNVYSLTWKNLWRKWTKSIRFTFRWETYNYDKFSVTTLRIESRLEVCIQFNKLEMKFTSTSKRLIVFHLSTSMLFPLLDILSLTYFHEKNSTVVLKVTHERDLWLFLSCLTFTWNR